MIAPRKKCPNFHNHEHGPEPYAEWAEWEKKMSKTHTLERCWGCNMMVIWNKKGGKEDELQKLLEENK